MSLEYEQRIAFGGDSRVYRVGDRVKKVYDGGPFSAPVAFDKVVFYGETTNKAASYISNNPCSITIEGQNYPVRLNPVSDINEEDGHGIILAPFIEGNPLTKTSDVGNARAQLIRISRDISQALGIKGIEITPGNAKLHNNEVVVTDICAAVRGLKIVTPLEFESRSGE